MVGKKIKDIKSTGELYEALRGEVKRIFEGYEDLGFFVGLTETQRRDVLSIVCQVLSAVWNPIQKYYIKLERKKAERAIKRWEENYKYLRERCRKEICDFIFGYIGKT